MQPSSSDDVWVKGFNYQQCRPLWRRSKQVDFEREEYKGLFVYRSSWNFGRGLNWVRVAFIMPLLALLLMSETFGANYYRSEIHVPGVGIYGYLHESLPPIGNTNQPDITGYLDIGNGWSSADFYWEPEFSVYRFRYDSYTVIGTLPPGVVLYESYASLPSSGAAAINDVADDTTTLFNAVAIVAATILAWQTFVFIVGKIRSN